MNNLLRRLALWTAICAVSAAPSFMFAMEGHDQGAMVVGVVLFILAYTAVTSTPQFERFHNLPFMRRTLYIGYGARMIVSLAFPIGIALDVFPGMLSIALVEATGLEPTGFAGTLVTTIMQGTFLNIILAVFMAAVYTLQRLTMKPPEPATRGFEVVLQGASQPRRD